MWPWICLFIAGLLEIVWAVGLKYTEGFTKPVASLVTIVALIASMGFLAKATQSIPIGTAYGIWVGIGAVGAAVCGTLIFGEAMTVARAFCLVLLTAAIVGLKFTTR